MLQETETETRSFTPNVASNWENLHVFRYGKISTGSVAVNAFPGVDHDKP
jgi:hypothetical protein